MAPFLVNPISFLSHKLKLKPRFET
jgi:hypothetical protein